MELPAAYIPMDRRQAMARGESLPDRTSGAGLFTDISGFTPLTGALMKELGPRRGAEELTRQLNIVYGALITEVHRYGGSVVGFSGDAITCWFDSDPSAALRSFGFAQDRLRSGQGSGQAGLRATACALAMQQVMGQFAEVEIQSGMTVSLAIKAAVTTGPVRRFLIGDPQIQTIDVLAGATLDRMAEAEKQAKRKEVVIGPEAISQLGSKVEILEWRDDVETGRRFAVVVGLACQVEATPWPTLLISAGETEREAETLIEEQIRSWLLPPVYERLRTGQGRFLAELRPAVALFLKFGGLDYDQDDAAGEKLDTYIRWVQNVVVRYENYVLQLTTGDKGSYLYTAFGAPLAHDDDPARAVAAAIELRSPPPEIDFVTGVQIGISQGRMRTGAYGGSTRRTYGVLGDEVNVAARLMEKAEPGQILVSKRIADAAAKSYHFEHLGPVEVKGKKDPLSVYAPLDRQLPSPQRPATIFTNPLVGRDDELAQIEEVLESVLASEGQILRLEGVAGVGKSHLSAEFVEQAISRGLRVALGACQSTSQGIAYYPWRQAFRALFELTDESVKGEDMASLTARQMAQVEAIVSDTNPGWLLRLPLLGDLLDLPIPDNETTTAFDPQLRQESLFALAVEIVQTWADAQPLLLLVEDAHWMDEASLGLVMALGRAIASVPVLLALVHRPPVRGDAPLLPDLDRLPYCNLMGLRELSPQGLGALVTNRLQGEPSALALSLIQAQAQGNPFFTEELVDTLREAGGLYLQDDGMWTLSEPMFNALLEANCLTKEDGQWVLAQDAQLSAADLGIPDSIHGIVLSRIDRLPELHKLTLKVASVIGRTFEFDLLARSHPVHPGQEVLLEQIEMLQARDFTRLEMPQPRLTYMFKHNITQEVIYQTLLEDQQRELHQAVGEALERLLPKAVERLVHHYSQSGVRDKTLFYLDKAARKTQQEYANETALNYYNQALALDERWEWRKGQVEVLHILGRREEERASLEQLEAGPTAPVFEVAYLWGQYYEAIDDHPQAQAAIERALEASRDQGDILNEMRCLTQFGVIAHKQGAYDQTKTWYNQALDQLQGQGQETYSDEEAKVLAKALNGLGIIHRNRGDFDQARACYEQALTLSRQTGNRQGEAQALNELGAAAFYQRHFAEALTYYRQALDIRRTIGDRAGEGTSLYNMAQVTRDAGDYGQAGEYLSAAQAILQATGNRWDEVNVLMDLGILYHELGNFLQAQTYLQQGLQLCRDVGDEIGQAYLLANIGLVARDDDDLVTAETVLNEGVALAKKHDDKHILAHLVGYLSVVSLRAGKLTEAIEQAKAALSLHRETNSLLLTADDLATLAEIYLAAGDTTEALNYAQQSLTILDGCGGKGPEFPQRDYFICHRVLAATGQAERARAAVQSAYDLVMARADKITDPALRQSFLERVPVNREIVQEIEGARHF